MVVGADEGTISRARTGIRVDSRVREARVGGDVERQERGERAARLCPQIVSDRTGAFQASPRRDATREGGPGVASMAKTCTWK